MTAPKLLLASFLFTVIAFAAPLFEESDLFLAGADGYHTYRIPSLFVTAKGSVLAFCEGRKTGSGDHGDVDLVMKRSTDGGRTWSAQQIVYEEGGEAKVTIGNPCPVQDAATGTIWLPFCRDNKAVLITSSADDGQTWTPPRDLGASAVQPDWPWVATGPGIGIQLAHDLHRGRLVIPSDQRLKSPDGAMHWNSHMMFSDDAGKTWQVSQPIAAGGNECQVIERADGTLLVNTRMQGEWQGFRGIATSRDGGTTWSAIEPERQLPCPKCQGSLLRIGDRQVLFSNPNPGPAATGKPKGARIDLTVRLSSDDGATWPVSRLLHAGPSAYSCLGRLPDGTVLCLYEGGKKSASEALKLARFSLDWISAADSVLPVRGVCAHRGASSTFPENTLPAFREAVRLGAHMIEFDVQLTSDHALVLMHDPKVDRTTNGKGKVSDLTLAELQALDAGVKMDARFAGTQIPTFEETLAMMPRDVWLNCHLKGGAELGAAVARVIQQSGRQRQAFLAANAAAARAAREVFPDVLICNMERQNDTAQYANETIAMKAAFIQLLGKSEVPVETVKKLNDAGVRVNYYHDESPDGLRRQWNAGVNFPLVNDPATALPIAAELGIQQLQR